MLPELVQWGRPAALDRRRCGCWALERLIENFSLFVLGVFIAEILEESMARPRRQYLVELA